MSKTSLFYALLAALVAAVTSSSANHLKAPTVKCEQRSGVCKVTVQVSNGESQDFELVPEESSLFAKDATSVTAQGEEVPIHRRQLQGLRYHTRREDANFATALISEDKKEVIDGVFGTEKHGFYEFNHGIEPTVGLRRSLSTMEDLALTLPTSALRSTKNTFSRAATTDDHEVGTMASSVASAEDEEWSAVNANARTGTIIPFFPGCYPQDAASHVLKMNVILDQGVVDSLAANIKGDLTSAILANLEGVFAMGKLIFLSQLNVRLEVGKVILGSSTMSLPLSRGARTGTCTAATQAMDELMRWINDVPSAEQSGYWMLASNCFSGVNGVSYIGSMCGKSNNGGVAAYAWPVIFHELGHGFGMTHSFENGVKTTGGLMDYGDTLYQGVSQFHPNKRSEACSFLTYVKGSNCPYFNPAAASASCGDGILSRAEQCECLDRSKSCAQCVECKLTDASVQCSPDKFVVRTSMTPDLLIVEADALSKDGCCIKNRFAPQKTLCGDKLLDACGPVGQCVKVCTALLATDNPNCGFDDTGCKLGCMWKNKCRFDMLDGSSTPISNMPDGASCSWGGNSGMCISGNCLTAKGFPPSATGSHSPTSSPFANAVPQTSAPVRSPTKATQRPTTKTPTGRPTVFVLTQPPSDTAAQIDPKAKCVAIKKKAVCVRDGCKWCNNKCNPTACAKKKGRRMLQE